MITLFTYPNGGYQIINPTPVSIETPAGATRNDYATQAQANAAIAALSPVQPDWDGFNAYILGNTDFKATTATVRSTHPELVEALPSAYLLVGQGNPATFAFLIGQIYTVASVSEFQRDIWADAAQDVYNLPADFVAVVRGS